MRVWYSLLGLSLLCVLAESLVPPSKEDLKHLSQLGEEYVDKEIGNAINGVKEMKAVMEKSEQDHQTFLTTLERTKKQKEEALKAAQEMEEKLDEEQKVCNETTMALWEQCKPCLKNTCIKYYSRTCSSGSGLVGRQLEEFLNRSSPFSIWINGQNMETLEREDEEQTRHFQDLERHYSDVFGSVDSIFMDSMKVFNQMRSLQPGFFLSPFHRPSRIYRSLFQEPRFYNFHDMFQPIKEMTQDIFGSLNSPSGGGMDFPSEDGTVNEDVVVAKPFGDKMTCREIRRNSAGCIKLREECEKCKEIQHIDCSGKKPLEGPLKQELEQALALAEKFTQEYNDLLGNFEQEMFNSSNLLDALSKQFSWVSSLANHTSENDGVFKIQTVICKDGGDSEKPSDSKVSVKLFDEPEMTFTVRGDIPWTDPKFSEVVAQEALSRYKQNAVVVK